MKSAFRRAAVSAALAFASTSGVIAQESAQISKPEAFCRDLLAEVLTAKVVDAADGKAIMGGGRASEYGWCRLQKEWLPNIGSVVALSAEKGNVSAAKLIAEWHQQGRVLAKDLDKALYWYERAAQLGDVDAMYNAGDLLDGDEVKHPDGKKALQYLKSALEAGHSKAEDRLAVVVEAIQPTDNYRQRSIKIFEKDEASNAECHRVSLQEAARRDVAAAQALYDACRTSSRLMVRLRRLAENKLKDQKTETIAYRMFAETYPKMILSEFLIGINMIGAGQDRDRAKKIFEQSCPNLSSVKDWGGEFGTRAEIETRRRSYLTAMTAISRFARQEFNMKCE